MRTSNYMQLNFEFPQNRIINEFIKNAYEAGYYVEVNDHLEVVKVQRVDPVDRYRGSASIEGLSQTAQ